MKSLKLLLWIALYPCALYGQEICGNGIDDDYNGFTDCYDAACHSNFECADSWPFVQSFECHRNTDAVVPVPAWFSPNGTSYNHNNLAVGDLDNDGVPEIISVNRYEKAVYILNGEDGTIQARTTAFGASNIEPLNNVAIGNIQNDNCSEIFITAYSNNSYHIIAFDCQLNLLWRHVINSGSASSVWEPGELGLADFDGDGLVELYFRNEVRDALTGIRLVAPVNPKAASQAPIAADITGDPALELISGGTIYRVNLGSRTQNAGSLTVLNTLPGYFPKSGNVAKNSTSIVDYNQDGQLDVLLSGATAGDITTVFFWDVHNNTVQSFSDPIPGTVFISTCPVPVSGTYYQKGWYKGTGRIAAADVDGDGEMNAVFVSGKYLYALNENFGLLWRKIISEETSGYSGCTLFDLNGDGATEIIVRDEESLMTLEGATGNTISMAPCRSRTLTENPIVADVNGDGAAEICVACFTDDSITPSEFCSTPASEFSQVRVYKSATIPWVSARKVWNQHGYFSVNVDDFLAIPIRQQKHHYRFFWEPVCDGMAGNGRILNTFMSQSPYFSYDGCPVKVLAQSALDITYTGDTALQCFYDLDSGRFTATGGSAPYQFTVEELTLQASTYTNDTSLHFHGTGPGTIAVRVTDHAGCMVNNSVTITSPEPLIPFTHATDVTAYGAHDGTAFFALTGGVSPYQFFLMEDSTGGTTFTGDNFLSITQAGPGTVTVLMVDSNTCGFQKGVTINEPAQEGSQGSREKNEEPAFTAMTSTSEIRTVVYPNPTTEFVHIQGIDDNFQEISIFSSIGTLIGKRPLLEGRTLDLRDLPKGVYILAVSVKGKYIERYPIIKN